MLISRPDVVSLQLQPLTYLWQRVLVVNGRRRRGGDDIGTTNKPTNKSLSDIVGGTGCKQNIICGLVFAGIIFLVPGLSARPPTLHCNECTVLVLPPRQSVQTVVIRETTKGL